MDKNCGGFVRTMPHVVYDGGGQEQGGSSHAAACAADFSPPNSQQQGDQTRRESSRCMVASEVVVVDRVERVDVLCGRGAPICYHPGNQFFRKLVSKCRERYRSSERQHKSQVVGHILQVIRSRGGRFLKRTASGDWVVVSDAVAYEKTCQALREKRRSKAKPV